jgi:orotidine-5'-phosphate decarboxylase
MKQPVIIALDFPTAEKTFEFLDYFGEEKLFVKVGMELFYQEGPALLYKLKEKGHQIFLDLKLHDIPNTVYSAMKGIAKFDIDLITVHAAGGKVMMEAAIAGLEEGKPTGKERAKCIAVTQLTSMTEEKMHEEQGILTSLSAAVLNYANLAKKAGLDGVVSSVHEASYLRRNLGQPFLIITPGIRLPKDEAGDQKRVADPKEARLNGSSGIVVGRSITQKENPYKAYLEVKTLWGDK